MQFTSVLRVSVASAAALLLLAGCASQPTDGSAEAAVPQASPGTIAYDRDIWLSLIHDHTKIRREVHELPNGVDAVTESDDPDVAARIRNHAFAMQRRLRDGARVRQWDPVFVKLFDHAEKVKLDVQVTDKGVHIIETSDDPEVVRVLHSHAAGVSEMVREGSAVSGRETPMK
ncbi:MAG: hypothetical protein JNL80_17235 [Phycisphaerae bacterium]|jgi:hypothetical protein|nr:hypothetical protein [Phycisphaerae bacterium]